MNSVKINDKMDEELSKHGLYFDYLYNLRVLNPEIFDDTSDLKQQSEEYVERLKEFRQIINEFIRISSTVVNEVEIEKMHAISSQNKLKSMTKEREAALHDVQNRIAEKSIELEQLKSQLSYLQRIENDQQKIIDNFYERNYK